MGLFGSDNDEAKAAADKARADAKAAKARAKAARAEATPLPGRPYDEEGISGSDPW